MKKLKNLWIDLHNSFWFIPVVIVIASIALALCLVQADMNNSYEWVEKWPRLFGAGPEASRGMLSTVANTVMSMMTVSFSMTLVTLALASTQYTSRILRNFMKSQMTQITLGIFAGIFTYCLIVLRTIRGTEAFHFVPRLSVLLGFGFAVIGVATLVFFIHHIANSIQASTILANVYHDTRIALLNFFSEELKNGPVLKQSEVPELIFTQKIFPDRTGYLQSIDEEALLNFAEKHDCIFKMNYRVGDFITEQFPILEFRGKSFKSSEHRLLNSYFNIRKFRTIEQDPLFGIRQIVDVALKALSPGINDTTTAIMCIDYLTAAMLLICERKSPERYRYKNENLRLITMDLEFNYILKQAFDQIRSNALNNATVIKKLLLAFEMLLIYSADEKTHSIITSELKKLSGAINSIQYDFDRQELTSTLEQLLK